VTVNQAAIRPRRIGELLDASLKLYLGNARTLMGLAAFVVIPVQVLQAIVLLSTVSTGNQVPTGLSFNSSPATPNAVSVGATVTVGLAALVATTLVSAACVKAVSDAYLDQPTGIGSSLRFTLRRLPALIWMEVLRALGLILAFVALIIPGIYLYGLWAVAIPALLIDRVGPVRALGRSRALVKGRWWPTAGLLIVATIMATVVAGAFEALLIAVAVLPSHPPVLLSVIVTTAAGALSSIIVRPFQAAVLTTLYYDLRIRREGFDLQLIAEQLGLPAVSAQMPADRDEHAPGAVDVTPGAYGPESVGAPGGPPFWPPPPGWRPGQ
jgi:hypothetical protein